MGALRKISCILDTFDPEKKFTSEILKPVEELALCYYANQTDIIVKEAVVPTSKSVSTTVSLLLLLLLLE